MKEPGLNPVFKGVNSGWDERIREIGNYFYDSALSKYVWTYSGHTAASSTSHIGLATSSDGITWTRWGSDGEIITAEREDPYLVKVGSTYYLYCEEKSGGVHLDVACYTSTDLTTWTPQTDAVTRGASGSWDATFAASPTTFYENGTWYLFYEGAGTYNAITNPGMIGLATSTDGLTFTKHPNNPLINVYNFNNGDLTPTTGFDEFVPDNVIKIGSIYYMFFHYYNNTHQKYHNGVAQSTDLITWTKYIEEVKGEEFNSSQGDGNVQLMQLTDGTYRWYYSDGAGDSNTCIGYIGNKGPTPIGPSTVGTKALEHKYPYEEGLVAATTRQD